MVIVLRGTKHFYVTIVPGLRSGPRAQRDAREVSIFVLCSPPSSSSFFSLFVLYLFLFDLFLCSLLLSFTWRLVLNCIGSPSMVNLSHLLYFLISAPRVPFLLTPPGFSIALHHVLYPFRVPFWPVPAPFGLLSSLCPVHFR